MMENLLIHVGYPKCGSSWLQNIFFSTKATGLVAPWSNPCPWGAPAKIAEDCFVRNSKSFDPIEVRAAFQEGIDSAKSQNLMPVISAELLIDSPVGLGGYAKEVAHKLYETFPDSKVLILIREQASQIISSYRFAVQTGESKSLKAFIETSRLTSEGKLISRFEHLYYDQVISTYFDLFGRKNV